MNMDCRNGFEEIAVLQKKYIYALLRIQELKEQQQDFEIYEDLFGQIKDFSMYVYEFKQCYYGRALDWAEEYAFSLAQNIQEDLKNGNKKLVYNAIPTLINYLQKSNEEIQEILEEGLYNVDVGQMRFKNNAVISQKEDFILALDPDTMNPLEHFFFYGQHNKMTKWCHYFEVYHRHFQKYQNKPVTILEIGVWGGGSLQMWKKYFGDECRIVGIDIMDECKNYEEDRIKIYIGSQEDRDFLQKVKKEERQFDIIIDDGGHTMNQQIATFEELYPCLSEEGIYLCEDVMTSYWPKYGGGYKKPASFIEYSKNFIDQLNARYSMSPDLKISKLTQTIRSVHYYDSIVVIEKGSHKPAMVI